MLKIENMKNMKNQPSPPTCPHFKICIIAPNRKMAVVCTMYIYTLLKLL